jgi:hypothetical protein
MEAVHPSLILPELGSGRGTARRSRVVEGQARRRFVNNPPQHRVRVVEHGSCRNTQRLNSNRLQPFVTRGISLRTVAARMGLTVDLHGKPGIAAEKIEHISACRMQPAELQPGRALAEPMPEDHFGKGHLTPQPARVGCGTRSRLRCDVFEHGPSTVLRTVPLPETSSGRI